MALANQLHLEENGNAVPTVPSPPLASAREAAADATMPSVSLARLHADLMVPPAAPIVPDPAPEKVPQRVLWGQYNRLLPTIIALRTAAHLAHAKRTPWISLHEINERATAAARVAATYLSSIDRLHKHDRGEKLATALPGAEDNAAQRFQSQFIGSPTKDWKTFYGMPAAMGWVDFQKRNDGSVLVGLTQAGLEMACLPSPALDMESPSMGVTPEQRNAFFRRLQERLPDEVVLARKTVALIAEGKTRPEDHREFFRGYDTSWTDAVAETHRTGMLGRLAELGLVRVLREGQRSNYELTSTGRNFLAEAS